MRDLIDLTSGLTLQGTNIYQHNVHYVRSSSSQPKGCPKAGVTYALSGPLVWPNNDRAWISLDWKLHARDELTGGNWRHSGAKVKAIRLRWPMEVGETFMPCSTRV